MAGVHHALWLEEKRRGFGTCIFIQHQRSLYPTRPMDVAVDTNILLSDIWRNGQRMKALLDFVETTRSKLIVHDVVATEFRANAERQWKAALSEVDSAIKKAQRLGIGIEGLDTTAVLNETVARWEDTVRGRGWLIRKVELNSEVLPEAIRRAAHRIPPCVRSGEEVRDALMWLGLMEEYGARALREVAFISGNTRDFCGPDGQTLAPQLQADAAERDIRLEFFTSLDDFLRKHASPIAHFTTKWVSDRLDWGAVEQLVRRHLASFSPEYFHDWRLYEEWRPLDTGIHGVRPEISDVYVWEYSDERVILFVSFDVISDVVLHCERNWIAPDGTEVWHRDSFPTEVKRYIEISVEVTGEDLILLQVEDSQKM